MAMTMMALLSQAGCKVATAWKSEQIVNLAQQGNFDLIVLDVNMPGMDGFEVCEQLRANPRLRRTPVIFVSGSYSDGHRQRAAELGAADFISKPFNTTDFVSRVRLHAAPVQTSGTITATGDTA